MAGDRKLIRRLRHGDKDALAAIYWEHKDRMLTLAYRLLGDRAAAEDCLQDVFLKLARDAPRLRVRDNLSAYLASCVLNRARDERKKRLRCAQGPTPNGRLEATLGPDPIARLESDDEASLVQNALESLPLEQREVVTLHLQGGLTFKGIAELQSVSINTAQSRYRYGIRRLRELLVQEVGT